MNPIVEEYIKKKTEKSYQEEMEKRNEFLIREGIYEKIYSPDGKESYEYSCYEWNSEKQANVYFKKIPIDISDEEYEKVRQVYKLAHGDENEEYAENTIAKVLTVVAIIIYIVGVIAGFILGVESALMMLVYWVIGFIWGTTYLGLAEIIKLLQKIKNK